MTAPATPASDELAPELAACAVLEELGSEALPLALGSDDDG